MWSPTKLSHDCWTNCPCHYPKKSFTSHLQSERHRLLHFSSQKWKYFRDIFMQSILHADHHLFRIQLCLMMMIWSLSFKSIDHTSFNFQIFFKEKNSSFNLRFFFLCSPVLEVKTETEVRFQCYLVIIFSTP